MSPGGGQHPTINIEHPEKHQRPKTESQIQRECFGNWNLDLLWMLDLGCCLCPDDRSAAFRLQKPSDFVARVRNPMPFACIVGPCSPKAALLSAIVPALPLIFAITEGLALAHRKDRFMACKPASNTVPLSSEKERGYSRCCIREQKGHEPIYWYVSTRFGPEDVMFLIVKADGELRR